MKHHTGKIWIRIYPVGNSLHFKIVDSEHSESPEEARIVHLIYHQLTESWSGFLQHFTQRYILSTRECLALHKHFFPLW